MGAVRQSVVQHPGLYLRSTRLWAHPGSARIGDNFDFRRTGAARLRAGYARAAARLSEIRFVEADVVSDDFSDMVNGDRLDAEAEWTGYGDSAGIQMTGGGFVTEVDSNAGACLWTASDFGADQFVEWARGGDGTSESLAGVLRGSSTGGYIIQTTASALTISKFTAGSWSVPSATVLATHSDGGAYGDEKFRAEIIGGKITLFRTGSGTGIDASASLFLPVLQVPDTDIASGHAGAYLGGDGGGIEFEWFRAGSLTRTLKVVGAPTRMFAFERDDDESRIVVAHVGSMSSFPLADPEWTS